MAGKNHCLQSEFSERIQAKRKGKGNKNGKVF